MKKNIFCVIITALTAINVILTAIMFFVMLPSFQKTNALITQVASVLNLELDADNDAKGDADYTLKDLEITTVSFEEQQTINLQNSADGSEHYAIFEGYTVSVNKKADDYDDFKTDVITANQSVITDCIRNAIQKYDKDGVTEDKVKKDALAAIQKKFDTKSIVEITISNFRKQ